MTFKIGVDGGGTKTECILVDAAGTIVARQLAPGCNPNVAGTEAARTIVTTAITALRDAARAQDVTAEIVATQFFMSGAPTFWQELAATLEGFGRVSAAPDPLPDARARHRRRAWPCHSRRHRLLRRGACTRRHGPLCRRHRLALRRSRQRL